MRRVQLAAEHFTPHGLVRIGGVPAALARAQAGASTAESASDVRDADLWEWAKSRRMLDAPDSSEPAESRFERMSASERDEFWAYLRAHYAAIHDQLAIADAERQLWVELSEAVTVRKIVVRDERSRRPLPANDYGLGVAVFDELAAWAKTIGIELVAPLAASTECAGEADAPRRPLARDGGAGPTGTGTRVVHSTKTRTDSLSAIIDQACEGAVDRTNASSVWNQLVAMAQSACPPPPLLEYVEGDVKWQAAEGPQILTRRAFGDRFRRRAGRAKPL